MSTYTVLVLLSSLVIFSYLFDILFRKTRLPSVPLLLLLGIAIRWLVGHFQLTTVNLNSILPTLGSIGLVLIVLEGSLELKLTREKKSLIIKSILAAFFILLATTVAISYLFHLASDATWNKCIINAIPYSIISSAIAIPSVARLSESKKEFIVYESTFSDILGIIVFNFFIYNEKIDFFSFAWLAWDTLLIVFISAVFCLLLLYIIGRIKYHVKFFLILAVIILIYGAGRMLHLPSLVIVLAFGLFLGNAGQIRYNLFQKHLMYSGYNADLNQMHQMTAESAFLVRTFFFIIFGYIINIGLLTDQLLLVTGASVLFVIYLVRGIYLKLFGRIPLFPELFISPRGLISILLFLSIPDNFLIPEINIGLLFMVILSSSLIMSLGLIVIKKRFTDE